MKAINKEEVVWSQSDNYNATRIVFHCYYPNLRYTEIGRWTGEKKVGNSALCNKRMGMQNENEDYVPIEEIESTKLDRDKVCKTCLKMFDKL